MAAEAWIAPAAAAAGWVGQACFFSRFLFQWLASERARRSVVPRAFWWLSLAGSGLVGWYALERREAVLLPGYLVGGTIAARNLLLSGRRGGPSDVRLLGAAAVAFALVLLAGELTSAPLAFDQPLPWLVVGGLGQLIWLSRFPVQWWLSERAGESHFPVSFWWLSLAGNLLLLAYAQHLGDPVFVLGFALGPIVQVRNLMLLRRRASTA